MSKITEKFDINQLTVHLAAIYAQNESILNILHKNLNEEEKKFHKILRDISEKSYTLLIMKGNGILDGDVVENLKNEIEQLKLELKSTKSEPTKSE